MIKVINFDAITSVVLENCFKSSPRFHFSRSDDVWEGFLIIILMRTFSSETKYWSLRCYIWVSVIIFMFLGMPDNPSLPAMATPWPPFGHPYFNGFHSNLGVAKEGFTTLATAWSPLFLSVGHLLATPWPPQAQYEFEVALSVGLFPFVTKLSYIADTTSIFIQSIRWQWLYRRHEVSNDESFFVS